MLDLYSDEDEVFAEDLEEGEEPVAWAAQRGSQEVFLESEVFEVLYEGTRGPGKSQSVDALVMTPTGPRRIGNLRPGDAVSGSDGTAQRVVSVHPQGVKELLRLTFSDGSTAEASPDHLWQTAATGSGSRWTSRVCTTREMAAWMAKGKTLSIPIMTGPLRLPEADLPIEPYLMGLYLGDGCSIKHSVAITSADKETAEYLLGLGFRFKAPIAYRAPGTTMLHALRALGLEALTSAYKFVPEPYLWASSEQRLALLQGLMDSDGSIKKGKNQLRFGSISLQLADAVAHLIRSLGGWAKRYEVQRPDEDRPEYEVTGYLPDMASAFRLTRKRLLAAPRDLHSPSSRVKRYVKAIEPIGKCEQVCIKVSNPDSLYVAEAFVVTHNTDCLLMDFLQDVGVGYGREWRGVLFRRTYPELSDVVNKTLKWFPLIVPGASFNKSDYSWTFPDGEVLMLRHARVVADYWKYHGHAYPWIGWEEITTWPDDGLYRKMMSCCRSTNPTMPRKYRATTNPYGPGHNWVKKRFRLPSHRGVVIDDAVDQEGNPEPPRMAVHGALRENRILLDADPDYVSRLRASARNKAEIAAWLHGSWDIVAGGMLDDVWDAQVHVVAPFRVPRGWRVDRSLDWGSSKPFSVGWWAESDGTDLLLPDGTTRRTVRGDLFRIAEWYGCSPIHANEGLRLGAAAVAKGIIKREREMVESGLVPGRIEEGIADSSIDSSDNGPTVREDMEDGGVYWGLADKSPGSRKQGWEQLRKMLRGALNLDEEGRPRVGPREEPGVYFFRTCTAAVEQLPVLPRSDKDLDDVDTTAEDHLADEVRYRCRDRTQKAKSRSF